MHKKTYTSSEKCIKCGGKCCILASGEYLPKDFGFNIKARLLEGIKEKRIILDDWVGDPRENENNYNDMELLDRVFYPRVRRINDPDTSYYYYGSWGGKCIYLASDGCKIERSKKPLACKVLEPVGNCNNGFSKQSIAIAWIPYQSIILEIITKFNKKAN
jgi:Fe-S-cluster containining protein